MQLDETNCEILNILQTDCRTSLSNIARKVDLSVDSVKKRINKMKEQGYYYPKIQIRPRHIGFPIIVEAKIKLKDFAEQDLKDFVDYLTKHPRVSEIFAMSGEDDFSIVLLATDHEDLAAISDQIRNKFKQIIQDWRESLTKVVHKFEQYDLHQLMKSKTSPKEGGMLQYQSKK
ncbi:Lrp/AsnC family transcriptional regulator [Candidatus Woesearchaeota archaeon]|nr:Lrp/AsnC family transcriptional regulator [Candidatus Woesearchaeota archaeon]